MHVQDNLLRKHGWLEKGAGEWKATGHRLRNTSILTNITEAKDNWKLFMMVQVDIFIPSRVAG